jgi:hypothetical protein
MQCLVLQVIQKTKTCDEIVMLYSVRNVIEVLLDRQWVRYVLRCYLYNCNSLFICFLSHQVFIFTHMLSVHFSAFCMRYPRCNTLPVRTRNCRQLRNFRDVPLTPARIMDVTLSRMTHAPAAIFCRGIGTRLRQIRSKSSDILGVYIPCGLNQTKGEMCAKFGSDAFRNHAQYGANKHTNKRKQKKSLVLYMR